MPPQLTEAWAVAYLQILIVLLVFAFGIPALLFQITVPEEIRRIIHRYMKLYKWLILLVAIILACFSLCFIWILHPCSGSPPKYNYWVAGFSITAAIIITILFWWRNTGKLLRERVVRDLERRLTKKFNKIEIFSEKIFTDLIYLGERGEPGYEKELVLRALGRVAKLVQGSERYTGFELEQYLRDVDKILVSGENFGNEDNFRLASHILKDILGRLTNLNFLGVLDATLALRALGKLGVAAVEMKFDATAQMILEIVASKSGILFQIGLSALVSNRFLIAVAALNKLEALVLEQEPIACERAVNLLGLLAHFWTNGQSTRRRAELFLDANRNNFSPSFDECLTSAIEYHYSIAQFETADKLIAMQGEIG